MSKKEESEKEISLLGNIFKSEHQSDLKREITLELFDSTKNLDQKTEIERPTEWACLKSLSSYVKDLGLTYSHSIIENFIEKNFKFYISKDRKGRSEYIQALNSLTHLDTVSGKDEKSKITNMVE